LLGNYFSTEVRRKYQNNDSDTRNEEEVPDKRTPLKRHVNQSNSDSSDIESDKGREKRSRR
jgi:hypothetical protein